MPHAVVLSVCIGVAGCGCPNSSHVTRNGANSCAFMYSAPISASAADDITDFITFAMTAIGPLIISLLVGLFPKYVYPPAHDLALLATRNEASE